MNRTEALLKEITDRFGLPQVHYSGVECWRVWVRGWHIHSSSASHGSFAAHGNSAKAAAARLLQNAENRPVIKGDYCERSCPHHISSLDV